MGHVLEYAYTELLPMNLTSRSVVPALLTAPIAFDYPKRIAVAGTHDLVFTGRDDGGRERTSTLTLTIQ